MSSDAPRRHSSLRAVVPPAPPLPPERVSIQAPKSRVGLFDRIFGPRKSTSKPLVTARELKGQLLFTPNFGYASSQATSHKTGLRLRALDINESRTHVVLAGGKILKTVKVERATCIEDINIRNAAVNYPRLTESTSKKRSDKADELQQVHHAAVLQQETFDIEDVAWSNGRWSQQVATAAANGKVNLYDLNRPGVEVGRLHEHNRQVHKVDFSPIEGQLLLSASQDGTVRLWDLRSLENVMKCESKGTFPGRSDGVRHTKWNPTSSATFALATDNGTVQRWDIRQTRTPLLKIFAHTATCSSIDWHPDGRHLVSGGLDKDVKVWDLRGDRKQKPLVSMRVPNGVQNVRWRPPCYVTASGSNEQLVKQCTHLATSYRSYPVVHIWDLRRPKMPFKEYHHAVNDSTTDMLWQSKDLLWTVGPEGEFVQSDIRYLPRTLDRRPMSTFSLSARGELVVFSQRRIARRVTGLDDDDCSPILQQSHGQRLSKPSKAQGSHGNKILVGDDSLDENFLSSSVPGARQARRRKAKPVKSIESTPPSYEDFGRAVTELDQTIRYCNVARPLQSAFSGRLPGFSSTARFEAAAREWAMMVTDRPMSGEEVVEALEEVFAGYIHSATQAGEYESAQTFDVFKHLLIEDMKRSNMTSHQYFRRLSESALTDKVDTIAPLETVDSSGSPRSSAQSRISNLSQALQAVDDTRSTSDAATPLAKPVSDTEQASSGPSTPTLDLAFGALDPSPEQTRPMLSRVFSDELSGDEEAVRGPATVRTTGGVDSSEQEHLPSSAEDYPAGPHQSQSSQSLTSSSSERPFFDHETPSEHSESLISSQAAILASAHGSFAPGIQENLGHSVEASHPRNVPRLERMATSSSTTADANHKEEVAEVGSSPEVLLTVEYARETSDHAESATDEQQPLESLKHLADILKHQSAGGDTLSATKLFTAIAPLLSELSQATAGSEDGSTTLSRLESLTGVSPLFLESALSTYHDQLIYLQLHQEAASLRKLVYPQFPSIYEGCMDDVTVGLVCSNCEGDYSSAGYCTRCRVYQTCAICWSVAPPHDSPTADMADGSVSRDPSACRLFSCVADHFLDVEHAEKQQRARTASLMAACGSCGHVLHMACSLAWFAEGEGICPVDKCMCDCKAGAWREQLAREAETSKKSKAEGEVAGIGEEVKQDAVQLEDSEAVKKAVAGL